MQGDLPLAAAFLRGARRARKTAFRRFAGRAELAFEHCGEGAADGLRFDAYLDGVLRAASRSLLLALPETDAEAALDPHVERLLGRRDFPLVLRCLEGSTLARGTFRARFEEYLGALLFRSGVPSLEVPATIDALVRELFTPRGDDLPPMSDYLGRCDLRDWLFVYVREVFRGGMHAANEHVLPGREASDPPRRAATPEGIVPAFAVLLNDLSQADLDLALASAGGDDFRAEDPPRRPALLARRHELLQRLYDRALVALQRLAGGDRAAAEANLQDALAGRVEARLASLLGHPSAEDGS